MSLFGGEAEVSLTYFLDQEIEWDVNSSVDITKSFSWNVGLPPIRWYRVQGCCKYPTPAGDGLTPEENDGRSEGGGCDVIPFQTDDSLCTGSGGKVFYIQNIQARSLSELCEKLTNDRWVWEICSIKRWSRPYSNALISSDDQCNRLEEIPFSDVPECLEFALHTTGFVSMGVTTEIVDVIFRVEGSGGVYFGGTALAACQYFSYLGSGGIVFGDIYEPDEQYVGSGGVIFGGGEGGYSSTWLGEFDTEMGMESYVDGEEVVFGVVDAPPIEAPTTTIVTSCGICTEMPLLLHVHHNLEKSGVLSDFLLRNGQEIPAILPMYYSTRYSSWQANYHMRGLSEDNSGGEETWRVVFEWACVDEIGSQDLGGNAWKFSMLVVTKDLETGVDLDTRILISFPPDQICKKNKNINFDFSFNLDTKKIHVSTNLNMVVDVILLNDGIGLFKTKFWRQFPNFRVRLSENRNVGEVERKDIKPIFPEQELLVLV